MTEIIKKNDMDFRTSEIVEDIMRPGYIEEWISEQIKESQVSVNRLRRGLTQFPRIDAYFKLIEKIKKTTVDSWFEESKVGTEDKGVMASRLAEKIISIFFEGRFE